MGGLQQGNLHRPGGFWSCDRRSGGGKNSTGQFVFLTLRSWVYLFHMPAFFLLAGLFASKAVGRSWRIFLENKVKTLIYPYVLWTGFYLVTHTLMARYANNPPNTSRALHFFWEPYGYGLWFLYSLFLITVLFHGLRVAGARQQFLLPLAVALHIGAWFNVFGFWPILNTAMLNFIFFAVGSVFAETITTVLAGGQRWQSIMAGSLLLALMTILFAFQGDAKLLFGFITSLLGIAGVIALGRGLIGWVAGGFFSLLGFYSLEIYLGHALFSTAARVVWNRLGIASPWLTILFVVSAGVFVSLALAWLCQKLKFPYLFRWPQFQPQPKQSMEPASAAR